MRYHCPYSDCRHICEVVTKVHARTHGMERDELFKKYGKPVMVKNDPKKYRNNMKEYQAYKPY